MPIAASGAGHSGGPPPCTAHDTPPPPRSADGGLRSVGTRGGDDTMAKASAATSMPSEPGNTSAIVDPNSTPAREARLQRGSTVAAGRRHRSSKSGGGMMPGLAALATLLAARRAVRRLWRRHHPHRRGTDGYADQATGRRDGLGLRDNTALNSRDSSASSRAGRAADAASVDQGRAADAEPSPAQRAFAAALLADHERKYGEDKSWGSRRAARQSATAWLLELVVAGLLLAGLYVAGTAGMVHISVALGGALLWWLALGPRLLAAPSGTPVLGAELSASDEWGNTDDALDLDPRFAGVWIKDASRSDTIDAACDAMNLHGVARLGARLVRGLELRPAVPSAAASGVSGAGGATAAATRPALSLAVFSAVPFFRVRREAGIWKAVA
mmetsp:Transcript_15230/g.44847  ORF Transcript_15230/g.44847 Transcript_15230/m.44847 type:complete len:386 (-) Transcript_15230:1242-2399(-)